MKLRFAAALAVASLLAGACSDDGGATGTDSITTTSTEASDAGAATETTVATTTTEPGPLDPTKIPGEPINQFNLRVRDCFDQLEDRRDGQPVTITTKLSCEDPHHFEVYAQLNYPADHPTTYPGDTVVRNFAIESCYRDFMPWVGSEYETSALDIGVIIPNRENFEGDASRYRGIHCYVERDDGDPMVGTSRNSDW